MRFTSPAAMTRDAALTTGRTAAPSGLRLGERLRQLRVAGGLTQSDLAGERFSKEYVSQIERGKTKPTRETVEWLAARLGVDPGFLANGVATDERGRLEGALARAEALIEAGQNDDASSEYGSLLPAARATGVPELTVRALVGTGRVRGARRQGPRRPAHEQPRRPQLPPRQDGRSDQPLEGSFRHRPRYRTRHRRGPGGLVARTDPSAHRQRRAGRGAGASGAD